MLEVTAPWEWPEDARETLLAVLQDAEADQAERVLAAELAGDTCVIDDTVVAALLALAQDADESDELRGKAAVALGPALELADTDGFDMQEMVVISQEAFHDAIDALRKLYGDPSVPQFVRRRVLEGSVRARQPWHKEAVRRAYASDDEEWKLTAVFCMNYVRGFNKQIVESLGSDNPLIHDEAVRAAGNQEVKAAFQHIAGLIESDDTEKNLLLAAINAASSIRPGEAASLVADLANSDDEDIAAAADEAIAYSELPWDDLDVSEVEGWVEDDDELDD
ncbi:MAG: hypothetical protein JW889_16680 [Verrucomicrobia bacterium]|nr:hypothetical protein [Verrucomicrobiota bacterium]